MYLVKSSGFLILAIFGAFASADILSDVPRELLGRLFGSLNGLSYDIERQEVIEVPVQYENVPIKFSDENQNLQPSFESVHTTESSRRYLPTAKPTNFGSSDTDYQKKEAGRKQVSEGRTRNAYLPTGMTFAEDSPNSDSDQTDSTQENSSVDANDVRSADQTDE